MNFTSSSNPSIDKGSYAELVLQALIHRDLYSWWISFMDKL
jgi:hypothetical protein